MALISISFGFGAQAAPAAASSCNAVSVMTVTVTATAATGTSTSSSKFGATNNSFSGNRNNNGGGLKLGGGGNLNHNHNNHNNGSGNISSSKSSSQTSSSTSSSAAASSTASSGSASSDTGSLQSSLTLDPSVIAPGFAQNGQETPVTGQVASLTSTDNFINFCLTTNQPITNGQQVKTGSCNPAPMGQIPATTAMPSGKFTFPENFGTVPANQAFTITMAIQGMETGNFVNAQANYFAAPQQLNTQGQIIGHSHVVIEELSSLTQTTPTDPTKFAFFLGLNSAAQNGILTAAVANGLPAGAYKLSSINTAANHQPVLGPVAQHGSFDDMIYFTVSSNGATSSNSTASNTKSAAASTSTVSGSAITSTSAFLKVTGFRHAAPSTVKSHGFASSLPVAFATASPAANASSAVNTFTSVRASSATLPKASKA